MQALAKLRFGDDVAGPGAVAEISGNSGDSLRHRRVGPTGRGSAR
jgi:hypothetical protein